MANVKVKTFVSTQGEVFEGTRKELMDEYGIKGASGFNRKSGAVDANGDRWMEEDKLNLQGDFHKPKLYLGATHRLDKDTKLVRNENTGEVERVEYFKDAFYAASNTAGNYVYAGKVIEGIEAGDPQYDPSCLEDLKQMRASVEAQWDVIDNRVYSDTDKEVNRFPNPIERFKIQQQHEQADLRATEGFDYRAKMKRAAALGKLNEFKAGTFDPDTATTA